MYNPNLLECYFCGHVFAEGDHYYCYYEDYVCVACTPESKITHPDSKPNVYRKVPNTDAL